MTRSQVEDNERTLKFQVASLFINIGTTTEEVANGLASHEDLLVITNNIHVAMLLYGRPRIEVIVAGGPLRRSDGGIIGSAAVGLIRQFALAGLGPKQRLIDVLRHDRGLEVELR